jgi:hypothetical protein
MDTFPEINVSDHGPGRQMSLWGLRGHLPSQRGSFPELMFLSSKGRQTALLRFQKFENNEGYISWNRNL